MARKFAFAIPLLLLVVVAGCSYYHVIENGDTLYDLSREYGVSVQEIQRSNPGVDPYNLHIGEKLKIPRFPEQTLSDYTGQHRTPAPTHTPRPNRTPDPDFSNTPIPLQPTPSQTPTPRGSRFLWPVTGGHIAKRFGDTNGGVSSHGLDIEIAEGTPIHAIDAGMVVLASDRFKGYGNMVIVKHEGGLVSIYAHNRVNKVKKDQQISRGQVIAEVGQTGRVDRPTLHFELRVGSRAVDPLRYLPAR